MHPQSKIALTKIEEKYLDHKQKCDFARLPVKIKDQNVVGPQVKRRS